MASNYDDKACSGIETNIAYGLNIHIFEALDSLFKIHKSVVDEEAGGLKSKS